MNTRALLLGSSTVHYSGLDCEADFADISHREHWNKTLDHN